MPQLTFLRHFHRPWLGLAILLWVAWVAYAPGLRGGFLFDDFVNLPALGATGPVDNWPAFWRYVTSGTADPTGRPLALLSFLLDARSWPAPPMPFLRTNVLLHLCNGALLFLLLRGLGRRLEGAGTRAEAAALLGAGLWLLHPLFVSTTLYVVQREAMLPATFTLFALLSWLHGRRLLESAPRAGTWWMAGGLAVGTVCATLGKGNGLLVPLLTWVLEATVLVHDMPTSGTAQRRLATLRRCCLVLPSVAVAAYVLSFLDRLHARIDFRSWTLAERLLTEPRVLLDYLHLLLVPRALSTGLYNDAYAISTALLQPTSTLFAVLAVAGLLTFAVLSRRRAPTLAAALLFFFSGHLLESTTIPLELYFEHRNYLPAMLLFWPLARVVVAWRIANWLRAAIGVGLLALLAAITWQRASLWAQPERMAILWAAQNPASSRAQATAAIHAARSSNVAQVAPRLRVRWQQRPHDLQLALNYANAACRSHGLSANDVSAIGAALRHANEGGQLAYRWLERAGATAWRGACRGLDMDAVSSWIEAARRNKHFLHRPAYRQELHAAAGHLALLRAQPDAALAEFERAFAEAPSPAVLARHIAALANQGYPMHALRHLDAHRDVASSIPAKPAGMPWLHARVLHAQGYWPHEIEVLRGKLLDDIANGHTTARREAPR
jgi:hypothetical protein